MDGRGGGGGGGGGEEEEVPEESFPNILTKIREQQQARTATKDETSHFFPALAPILDPERERERERARERTAK